MFRIAALAVFVGVVLAASAQAESFISSQEAMQVAHELIQRNAAYYSAHPERAVNSPEWRFADPADPILVHAYPELEPSYYVVPVVNPENQVISLIGVSAEEQAWQWYARVHLNRYPQVSRSQALMICQLTVEYAQISSLKVVEMPNKKFYWLCELDDRPLRQIFVSIDDPSEVCTNLDPGFSSLTAKTELVEIDSPLPEKGTGLSQSKSYPYPDFYNMEVPFYYQDSSFYCGEASLEMVFDYWGPDIGQDDIGDVADAVSGLGTNRTNMIRASHFSSISTAIQNPAINGYSERPLGYCGNYQRWSLYSHFITRYEDLKNLISNDYPVLVLTWYSAGHTAGHYRVVKGYDDDLDVFIVHDPWYTPPYSGPDVHFNQAFLVDDLWLLGDRWGLFSASWHVDIEVDSLVGTEQLFTVNAEFEYRGPHPFENQYVADSIQATIVLPAGYQVVDPSSTIYFDPQGSGYSDNAVWQVSASPTASGPDTISVEVKAKISGSSNSYPSYLDWIGGTGDADLRTIDFVAGDANGDDLIDLGDAVYILNYLFKNGSAPVPLAAGDTTCNGAIDLADVVYLLNYLFKGGPQPNC